jgi:hypothetical protein
MVGIVSGINPYSKYRVFLGKTVQPWQTDSKEGLVELEFCMEASHCCLIILTTEAIYSLKT